MAYSDPAYDEVNALLDKLERQLAREYELAAAQMQKKAREYFDKFTAQDKKQRALLEAGEITQKEYADWRRRVMLNGSHWSNMRDTLAQDATNADMIAMSIVKQYMPEAYAIGHNYGTYEIEHGAAIDTSYTLYDRATVERLWRENPKLLPDPAPNSKTARKLKENKDLRWNSQHIQSTVTQGILQGKPLNDVAMSLMQVTEMDYNAARRNAGTMMTSSQNGGRIDSYERAESMGIEVRKTWIATLDGHTRSSHIYLDGQTRDIDEPFESEIGELMFPGDPNGEPADVYNCRCTLISQIKGFERDPSDLGLRHDEALAGMTYEEWKGEHIEQENTSFESKLLDNVMGADYNIFKGLVENSDTLPLYEKYVDTIKTMKREANAGEYRPRSDTLLFDYDNYIGRSMYSTEAHEIGHAFDFKMGRFAGLSYNEIDTINSKCKIFGGVIKVIDEVPSASDEFLLALRTDMKAIKPKLLAVAQELNSDKALYNASHGVQDALDGFYGTQKKRILGWGHGDKYYNKRYNQRVKGGGAEKDLQDALKSLGLDASNQTKVKAITRQYTAASEAWANIASAVTVGGEELKAVEKYLPNTVAAFRKICKGVK
jgi:hypothetical protein